MTTVKQPARSLSPLLTRAEVADLMRMSEHTIDRWCREGRLTRIRVGRGVRFRPEDVAALIDDASSREPVRLDLGNDDGPEANRAVEKEGAGAAQLTD